MAETSPWRSWCLRSVAKLGGILGLALIAHAQAHPLENTSRGFVEVIRTQDGVAHILAQDWRGVGLGTGHAQAEDAFCVLSEAFMTFDGRRSYFFGADAHPGYRATFTGPTNLELDIFFRGFLDERTIVAVRAAQPPAVIDLLDGYAKGYNRYLREARSPHANARLAPARRRCVNAAWARPITSDDLLKRMHAAVLAAGYVRFIPQIVNARPPGGAVQASVDAHASPYPAWPIGDEAGLGSNMIAFGDGAARDGAVLFGNPHWYWGGPDRFHQIHQIIPGHVNVSGVSFLGIPTVMIGFNGHVAWSHTVSVAKRFGLSVLTLDAADPTAYRVDGRIERMTRNEVEVPMRDANGQETVIRRTLYSTRFGPVIDFGGTAPQLGWSAASVLAIRDINADNHRLLKNYMAWAQASSLDEFVEIQKRYAALPWVNTAAIGRGDGRAWYANIGAVPGVPDTLRQDCASPLGQVFSRIDPNVPVLDGSRSACVWRTDPSSVQAGALPPAQMPSLFRKDYVANMNDGHRLSNPAQPLEGYAAVLGDERSPPSLRTRQGHALARKLIDAAGGDAFRLAGLLRRETLSSRDMAAALFKRPLLAGACASKTVRVSKDGPSDLTQPRDVDVQRACEVLKAWNNEANKTDRGALLWDAFWRRVEKIPAASLYAVPYSSDHPLDTPSVVQQEDPRVAEALGAAVLDLERRRIALDAPVSRYLFAESGGRRVPLYGGCGAGYFTIACPDGQPDHGLVDARAHANTYLQIVRFLPEGVEAYTMLAHGNVEAAVQGSASRQALLDYAGKHWRRLAFDKADLARQSILSRHKLSADPSN